MIQRLLLSLALLLSALPASAQTSTHLTPRLEVEGGIVEDKVEAAIVFESEPGWHGYWKNPGDAGLPFTVEWDVPEGVTMGPIRFPTPMRYEAAGLTSYVYRGEHAFLTEIRVTGDAPMSFTVEGEATWLACTDKVCVPERGRFATVVGRGRPRAEPDADFARWRSALPRPLAGDAFYEPSRSMLGIAVPIPADLALGSPDLFIAQNRIIDTAVEPVFRREGDQLIAELALHPRADPAKLPETIEGVVKLGSGQGLEFTARPGDVPTGGSPLADTSAAAILAAMLGALVGGLILNLMPCVFPVLTMKALHLARSGTDETRARRDALGYTLGAVAGTAALGVMLLFLRAGGDAVGWAFQLQDPRTIFLLLLLAAAITLNLIGLFELPVVAGEVEARSSIGTGALAAFVATPCAGPFLGTALGTALILPPAAALGIFAMLGLGLALPFLAIGFVPALRNRLPRPGPWMDRLKRYLAIPMAATVAACLWLLWRLAGPIGLTSGMVALGLMIGLFGLLGRRLGLLRYAVGGSVLIAVLGLFALPSEPVQRTQAVAGATSWSPQRVAAASGAGRPVFVYFTADWCLTCKANEKIAIDRDDVREAFEAADVAVYVADWTDGNDSITRFLEKRGRAAVPVYLWYAPGATVPEELPQILTPGMLVERAEAAKEEAAT
ncbi:protein-disulfide reductase DsbD family protein [Sphingomicrobium arenosum]|uniref:protein-disulfide reductase DsbD family protein n=1 Tax=Sphingomicrobium arenosum TaxID=2233861 RepID=UPI00223EC135|nr:protein-disulfide reductase DsbD domain-containing protein [Sphingomicrobium arenosum]